MEQNPGNQSSGRLSSLLDVPVPSASIHPSIPAFEIAGPRQHHLRSRWECSSESHPGGFGKQSLAQDGSRALWGDSPRHISHPGGLWVFPCSIPNAPAWLRASLQWEIQLVLHFSPPIFPGEKQPPRFARFVQRSAPETPPGWAGAGWGLGVLSPRIAFEG